MAKILRIIILFLIYILPVGLIAQTERTEVDIIKDKQRVNHVYNFANYIYWEDIKTSSKFIIGIVGELEESLVAEFLLKASLTKIKGLPVKIKYFKTASAISDAHVLYVNERQGLSLTPILEKAYLNNTLVVSENYPFHTSMINFIDLGSDFNFEIDQQKIAKAQLLINPELLSFSVQKTTDWEQLYDLIQKERDVVKEQKLKLRSLTDSILKQKDLVSLQRKNIISQNNDLVIQQEKILNQNNELNQLFYNINHKNKLSDKLQKLLEEKTMSVEQRNSLIDNQTQILDKQKEDIKKQEERILSHQKKINRQLQEIELQRFINYGLVVFFILAILFGLYVYRNNKREKRDRLILEAKNKDLAALNESLDSFVYRISHDLKAPIVNIKNMLTMLQNNLKTNSSSIPQIMDYMNKSTTKLEDTVLDLLELVRLERTHESKLKLNLTQLFNEILDTNKEPITEANAKVIVDFSHCNSLLGTKPEIISIFQNLLTNSLKYRSPDRLLEINVSTRIIETSFELTYEDNGIGMDIEMHEKKLFKMFQRFNIDNSIEGTGVGMYIINKLVSGYGGQIQLTGDIDKGLKYIITFPNELKIQQ